MIYLYSGTPGSGKSLHTARVIRNTLMLNKPVGTVLAHYGRDASPICVGGL